MKHKRYELKRNITKFRFAVYLIFLSVALEVINPESRDGLSWMGKHLESHGGSFWVGICLESHGVSSWLDLNSSCLMGQPFDFGAHFHSPHLCLLFHQLLEEDTHHKHNMLYLQRFVQKKPQLPPITFHLLPVLNTSICLTSSGLSSITSAIWVE